MDSSSQTWAIAHPSPYGYGLGQSGNGLEGLPGWARFSHKRNEDIHLNNLPSHQTTNQVDNQPTYPVHNQPTSPVTKQPTQLATNQPTQSATNQPPRHVT